MTRPDPRSRNVTTVPFGPIADGLIAFDYLRTHYTIYPWAALPGAIGRVLTIGERTFDATMVMDGSEIELRFSAPVDRATGAAAVATLRFAVGADEPDVLGPLAAGDAVIAAALKATPGISFKRYPALFEAVCGAICGQNVDFRRLYSMMRNLSTTFGSRAEGCEDRHAFPVAGALAGASEPALRACKVGYRAKAIRAAAEWWERHGATLDPRELRDQPLAEAVEAVAQIPFIGPYSAAIVLSAGCGRHDVFQLDSFTREILITFYFAGTKVSDEELRAFVSGRWPGVGGAVAHLLTTNTETWAAALGQHAFRRSRARG